MSTENDTLPQIPASPAPSRRRRGAVWPLVAVAALALAGWQVLETRQRLAALDETVVRRLADAETAAQQARGQAEALASRLGALEGRFGEFREQGEALQAFTGDIARGREEATLLAVEQAVTLAVQQLQLAGNVPVALLALQTADARLARLDQAQLLPLRKALAKDLQHLESLPVVDVPGLSLRLEQAISAIDRLPLAARAHPERTPENGAPLLDGWRGAVAVLWREIQGLVRIERFDGDAPALVAPGQEFFLRENLKLRLLNARLALLSRDTASFRNELAVSRDWLARHFAAEDKGVQTVQALLAQGLNLNPGGALPDLADTLAALRALRPAKDKR